MPHFNLRLDTTLAGDGEESFYWTLDSNSSFLGSLGPSLGRLGAVPALNIDLVRVAVGVYAADRSAPRKFGGSDWNQRNIDLTIPVSDASAWTEWADELAAMLAFLSGDEWNFTFVEQPAPGEDVRLPAIPADRVVLLSGGGDSAVGAVKSRLELPDDGHHILVSHYSASHIAPVQESLASQLDVLVPRGLQSHEIFHLARRATRIDGTEYDSEPSSRSRSFLFLSLGLAVASVHDVELWIPENGFASINPPLGPDRRGSLSTRTTHPAFIEDFNIFLARAGIVGHINNPFGSTTKGEMFAWATRQLGADSASAYLSSTNSCSSTGQRSFGIPLRVHCGVCFGCVLRRAAFNAADLPDLSEYADPANNDRLGNWLDRTSVVPAVRAFVARGVRPRDLMALALPHEYALADAMNLTARGTAELAGYVQ
jgi:7-cyano-7-deazaguanine synthase in queuosine biosynthesis